MLVISHQYVYGAGLFRFWACADARSLCQTKSESASERVLYTCMDLPVTTCDWRCDGLWAWLSATTGMPPWLDSATLAHSVGRCRKAPMGCFPRGPPQCIARPHRKQDLTLMPSDCAAPWPASCVSLHGCHNMRSLLTVTDCRPVCHLTQSPKTAFLNQRDATNWQTSCQVAANNRQAMSAMAVVKKLGCSNTPTHVAGPCTCSSAHTHSIPK